MGQKKCPLDTNWTEEVSFLVRCQIDARVVFGMRKGVLFREVSSVQDCPYREVPL